MIILVIGLLHSNGKKPLPIWCKFYTPNGIAIWKFDEIRKIVKTTLRCDI